MSLNAVRPLIVWTGNDVATTQQLSVESVPITFQSTSYIKVKQLVVATGVITTMTEGVDYSISPSSVAPGAVSPATLTRTAGALASGTMWAIYREQPYAQSLDIDQGGAFSSTDIEAAADRSREIDQEVGDKADRAFKISLFDSPVVIDVNLPPLASQAGKVLTVKATEDGFEWGAASGITFSIGTVTTGVAGSDASVSIGGTQSSPVLNFTIPRGDAGANGSGSGDLLAAQNLNDVADKPTAFGNIKQAASVSATGVVELATDAEAAGGTTNDTTRYITADHLHKARENIASATTTNIGGTASNFISITGTTSITSFGTAAAGVWRDVTFAGALTLAHNATSLILPGGANISTAANDRLRARSLGSGNWIVLLYVRASGAPLVTATAAQTHNGGSVSSTLPVVPSVLYAAEADIASATTTAIGATSSHHLRITGTTTITSFGSIAAGTRKKVRFQGALTLTHNGTSLILPGGASITTAANDRLEALSLGSGNWIVLWYQKADGTPVSSSGAGKLVTRAYAEYLDNEDFDTLMPYDDSTPQNTEGDEALTVAITLASASNRVRITVSGFGVANSSRICCALFRDSVANALVAWAVSAAGNDTEKAIDHVFEYAPSLSGAVTFKLRVGPDTADGIVRLNGNLAGRAFGGVAAVKMVVEEISP
jgi:hypothetical protein